MNKIGIVSYNMHYNYSNYGSILQTYALQEIIRKKMGIESVVIDYCPELFRNSNPKNPLDFIQNRKSEFYKACEILLNDIEQNEMKIRRFLSERYNCSSKTYYKENFQKTLEDEQLVGYVCGSDAIWSYDYFQTFDDAFYGNYRCMQQSYTISYAASFGETIFSEDQRKMMLKRMKNFKAIGVRESTEITEIVKSVDVPVRRVLDPTFLLCLEDYKQLMAPKEISDPYLVVYSRRYDPKLYETAKTISHKYGLKIIEISLDIRNAKRNIHKYSAGIEEFLSLIYYSDYVITNSLHGTIFSIIMSKNFYVYPRVHGEIKIKELLELLNISERKLEEPIKESEIISIDYNLVHPILTEEISASIKFLHEALSPIVV